MSGEDLSSSTSSLSALIQDPISNPNPNPSKLKRSLRGTPDPDAEVIALSPATLMAKNRFVCEICNKGFQRDQNLQLHRRGHNLAWKLKQRNKLEDVKKKVYICPEVSCVHHDPTRALGDLTGVKKHYFRKHGEKKWKCEKCCKKYAVQSDWKAHSKICGTREYKCGCGTLFSRKDSFITHRAFCDALTEENPRMASFQMISSTTNLNVRQDLILTNGGVGEGGCGNNSSNRTQYIPQTGKMLEINLGANSASPRLPIWFDRNESDSHFENPNTSSFLGSSSSNNYNSGMLPSETLMQFNSFHDNYTTSTATPPPPPHMSATTLLQKAAQMGSTRSPDLVDTNQVRLMNTNIPSNFGSSNNNNDAQLMMMMMMNSTDQSMQSKGNELNGLNKSSHDSDFTRDFLGVGGNGTSTYNLEQNIFKFSS